LAYPSHLFDLRVKPGISDRLTLGDSKTDAVDRRVVEVCAEQRSIRRLPLHVVTA
jgi:hypothetical protein